MNPAKAPCPNCGQEVMVPSAARSFVCRSCGEALRVTPEGRLFLFTPITTYSVLAERTERAGSAPGRRRTAEAGAARPASQRQTVAAGLATQRLARQRRDAGRIMKVGIGLIVVALLFLGVVAARVMLVDADWSSQLAPALMILALVVFGIYFVAWSVIVIRASNKEEKELHRELQILRGKVDNDS